MIDPLVWDQGSRTKVRRVDNWVVVDLAQLPGPLGFLDHDWVTLDSGFLTALDVSGWPFSSFSFYPPLASGVERNGQVWSFKFGDSLSFREMDGALSSS